MALPTFKAHRLLPKPNTHTIATAVATLLCHCIVSHPSPVSADHPSLLHEQPFRLSTAKVDTFRENLIRRFFRLLGLHPPLLPVVTMSEAVVLPDSWRLSLAVVDPAVGMTAEELKKVLGAVKIEASLSVLRSMEKISISYKEFLHFYSKASSTKQVLKIAICLDNSGVVIVLSEVVIHHTGQHAKDMRTVNAPHFDNGESEELKQMEEAKAVVDKRVATYVRIQMRLGQGFFMAQTVWFMNLTWDISWDIMEPFCFYLGCIYAIMGYGFNLRTGREPSFEGIFVAQFAVKQKKSMKKQGFDHKRFTELKRTRCGSFTAPTRIRPERLPSNDHGCHCSKRDALLFRGGK